MKVFTNNVPDNCDYLTNGKHYEFRRNASGSVGGSITNDSGNSIYVITQNAEYNCAHLNGKAAWEIVHE